MLALLGAFVALATLGLLALLRDPTPRFLERRSHLLTAHSDPAEIVDGHWVQTVRLTAASGLQVDLTIKRPTPGDSTAEANVARAPLVVLLGGHRTGRNAVKLVPHTYGTIAVALSYPYHGPTRFKGAAILRWVPTIRGAILDTPPAVMLALDYLLAQPYVDTRQVEGVGVSLGVPFISIAAALDPRITRVWLLHGSGGSYAPLEQNMRRQIAFAPLRVPAAALANTLIAGPRIAAERWVPRIAPRPLVMVNAADDERLPRASVERLHAAALDPKEIIWLPGRHVRSRAEAVEPLVAMVLGRVARDGERRRTLATPPAAMAVSTAR